MKEIIEKLLQEPGIDQDIKDFMLTSTNSPVSEYVGICQNWAYLNNPVEAILAWQELRDRNKVEHKEAPKDEVPFVYPKHLEGLITEVVAKLNKQ